MLTVIGTSNCNRCEMTKTLLDSKGIPYQYMFYEKLEKVEQDYYFELARKSGNSKFPIILKDGEVINLHNIK